MANKKGKKLQEGEVIACGHVYARSEATGDVVSLPKATVTFTCCNTGKSVESTTNEEGAYLAPLAAGEYEVKIVDSRAESTTEELRAKQTFEKADGPIIRKHYTLAESFSRPHEAGATALVYEFNPGYSPVSGAKVIWYDCTSHNVIDDNAPLTNASGITAADFASGDRYTKVSKGGRTEEYSCEDYPDNEDTMVYLDFS